jgi:hypothetical protein
MPSNSRIWIYQAPEILKKVHLDYINTFLANSIESWDSHGAPIKGSFKIFYDRILIIAADQSYNAPSGCSIDASGRWLKEINNAIGIDFFDRSLPYFDENHTLKYVPILEIKKYVTAGLILPDTYILNNQIQELNLLLNNWKIKAKESFLKRHFETVST